MIELTSLDGRKIAVYDEPTYVQEYADRVLLHFGTTSIVVKETYLQVTSKLYETVD